MKKELIIVLLATFALATFAWAQARPRVAIVRGDENILRNSWTHDDYISFLPDLNASIENPYWAPEWTEESEREIEQMVRKAVELAGGWPVHKGNTVLIKVNANADLYSQLRAGKAGNNELLCMTTDARVARAVAVLAKDSGADKIYIAEAPATADAICSLMAFGHAKYIKEIVWKEAFPSSDGPQEYEQRISYRTELVSLNDSSVEYVCSERPDAKTYAIPKVVLEADVVISVSPIKTHYVAGFSGTLKNIGLGVPPATVYGAPKIALAHNKLANTIARVCSIVDADYGVISAIYGGEGYGPLNCDPVYLGMVIASSDLVAVDATAVKVMGFTPSNYGTLNVADRTGLGNCQEIKVIRAERRGTDFERVAEFSESWEPFHDVPDSSRKASGLWGDVEHWKP